MTGFAIRPPCAFKFSRPILYHCTIAGLRFSAFLDPYTVCPFLCCSVHHRALTPLQVSSINRVLRNIAAQKEQHSTSGSPNATLGSADVACAASPTNVCDKLRMLNGSSWPPTTHNPWYHPGNGGLFGGLTATAAPSAGYNPTHAGGHGAHSGHLSPAPKHSPLPLQTSVAPPTALPGSLHSVHLNGDTKKGRNGRFIR